MSSTSPFGTKEFALKINALGCDYLDAPVSGGDVGAQNATLAIMVGGPQAAFERIRPLFEAMGKNINRVGGTGDGHTAKLANQIIVGRRHGWRSPRRCIFAALRRRRSGGGASAP